MNQLIFKSLQEAVTCADAQLLIVTHCNPDFDAVASSLAFSLLLDRMHISNHLIIDLNAIEPYLGLPGSAKLNAVPDLDIINTVICLDTATPDRIYDQGFIKANRSQIKLINIDHHITNTNFGDINLIEDTSSVGELLFNLFNQLNWPIDSEIANCLYTSILSDTGGFRFANVTESTLKAAGELIQAGAENCKLAQMVFENKKYDVFKCIRIALDNLVVNWDLGFAYTTLPPCDEDYGQEVIDFIRVLERINVFLVFRDSFDHLVRISIRSKNKFDVSDFAGYFGGGGHKAAAGIKLRGEIYQVTDKVITRLMAILAQQKIL